MKYLIVILFLSLNSLVFSQSVETQIERLEQALLAKDSVQLDQILHKDLTWGHSNAWIQTKEDVFKDFRNGTLQYDEIISGQIINVKIKGDDWMAIRREGNVKGRYKTHEFEIKLQILEIWTKERNDWKLWSRQAIKVTE